MTLPTTDRELIEAARKYAAHRRKMKGGRNSARMVERLADRLELAVADSDRLDWIQANHHEVWPMCRLDWDNEDIRGSVDRTKPRWEAEDAARSEGGSLE